MFRVLAGVVPTPHPNPSFDIFSFSGFRLGSMWVSDPIRSLNFFFCRFLAVLCRASTSRQQTPLEAPRCVLTAVHFPDNRTLTADESIAEPLPATLNHLLATAQTLLTRGGHSDCTAHPAGALQNPQAQFAEPLGQIAGVCSRPGLNREADGSTDSRQAGSDPAAPGVTDVITVRYHTAGYDPVWLLLFAVKVSVTLHSLTHPPSRPSIQPTHPPTHPSPHKATLSCCVCRHSQCEAYPQHMPFATYACVSAEIGSVLCVQSPLRRT